MAFAALSASDAVAQQDGLVAFPNVYTIQFENPWVRLIRVKLPAHAQLADHSHPPGLMLHLYFNDAEAVQFNHDGPPNDVTRPPVKARSYRVGRATPEVHSVVNLGSGMSDYMRVELKTQGNESQRSRIPAPVLENATSSVIEVNNAQYRTLRLTVAAGGTTYVKADSTPVLLIALTDGVSLATDSATLIPVALGGETFVPEPGRVTIRNVGTVPAQLLRVDLWTPPIKP